ncbi:ABC transporter ATP-binding protein [Halocola ammonii]
MSEVILSTKDLSKNFGKVRAVNNLNLEVMRGQVFGLLGPNGSGKTTTLGMLLGVVNPSSGSFSWFGEKGDDKEVRKRLGAILEKPVFYPHLSAVQNLKIVCKIKEIDPAVIPSRLEEVGLLERKDDKFKSYSLGMKQRLAIASALLCDPELLILDEPTNGLDPQGIAGIRQLIMDIASSGKTILLASHLLSEVQKICTDFCVLRKGDLIYTGNVATDLSSGSPIEIGAEDLAGLEQALQKMPEVESIRSNGPHLQVMTKGEVEPLQINRQLVDNGIVVSHLQKVNRSLEDQFLKILEDNHE